MKAVLYSAAIGAGIALIAFAIDWLAGRLDEIDEPEPLWPASKPFSRTVHHAKGDEFIWDPTPPWPWPPTSEETARIKSWIDEERAKR